MTRELVLMLLCVLHCTNLTWVPTVSKQIETGGNGGAAQRWRTRMFAHARSFSVAVVLTAASLFGLAGEAAAMQCANHDSMAKTLTGKFKETRRAMGVVNSTAVMEVFMSPQGTWTVVVTDTRGIACIAASGDEWQDVPVAVSGLES